MLHHYSIVIHPHENIIELFKSYKAILFNTIGNFGSRNSLAHITILEFDATDEEVKFIIEKLSRITQKEISFDSVFDTVICSDISKSIFILPDKSGNEYFKKLLKNVRQKIKENKNTTNAHLTIGRKLSPEQIEKSKNLFSNVTFDFHCNQLALRKFDPDAKQFEIIHIFPFTGKPNQGGFQQTSIDWDC